MSLRTEQRRPEGNPDGVQEIRSSHILPEQAEGRIGTERLDNLRAMLGSFARRMIEEALLNEMPAVWERRARQIEAGHPMIGNTLLEDIPNRAEAAAACREHAELLRRYPELGLAELGDVVGDALAEQGVAA